LRDVDFSVIERTRKILDKPGGCAQTELVSGLRATLSPGVLTIKESLTEIIPDSIPQVQPGMTSSLDIPGKVGLANGWAITARRGEFTPETPTNCDGDPYCAYLDAEKLELPLLIRGWNTGDRFSPFGMEGHTTKLSDFWINQKIPRVQRKNWPLVLSGKNIAWIPGNRLGEDFRLTQKSHKVVELVCQKE
jgi:tRNA(Ile)-lysidine synthase